MKRSSTALFAYLLALLGACTYTESGIYYADPVPGPPPTFSVTTSLDTLVDPRVADSLEVRYDVTIENGKFYQVEAYVQGEFLFSSDSILGAFWITTGDVPEPGVDTLRIWFFYNTNSNSLADIMEVEFNVVLLKYGILFEGGGL